MATTFSLRRCTGALLAALLLAGGLAVAEAAVTPQLAHAKATSIKIGGKTYSAKKNFKAGKVSWSKKSQTLTLKSAKKVKSIYVKGTGTVKLKVSGSCTMASSAYVKSAPSLKFTGTGTLSVSGSGSYVQGNQSLYFAGAKVKVSKSAKAYAVRAYKGLQVSKGSLTVASPTGYAAYCMVGSKASAATLKVSGGTLAVTGTKGKGVRADNITVSGGKLSVSAGDVVAASHKVSGKAYGGVLTVSGGSVKVAARLSGDRGDVQCSRVTAGSEGWDWHKAWTATPTRGSVTVSCTGCGSSTEHSMQVIIHVGSKPMSTPLSCKELSAYSWKELKCIANLLPRLSNQKKVLAVAEAYNLTGPGGKLTGAEVVSTGIGDAQIIGFCHDDKTTRGKAGITFMFKDIVWLRPMNTKPSSNGSPTNAGGWEGSELREYLNSDDGLYGSVPADLKDVIAPVRKLTNNTGNTYDLSKITATEDGLWLLSAVECYGTEHYKASSCNEMYFNEGSQYQLFEDLGVVRDEEADGNFVSCEPLIKNKVGTDDPEFWWLRTPNPEGTQTFEVVSKFDGDLSTMDVGDPRGVVPCFCL